MFYAIREYYISFKERPPSITDVEIDNWKDGEKPLDLENLGSMNCVPSDNSIAKSTKLGIRKFSQVSKVSMDLDSQLVKNIDDFKKIEIIYDEINSGEVQSVDKYLYQQNQKITYNLKEFNDIKEMEPKVSLANSKIIKMSEILSLLSLIPETKLSTYETNKLINSIKLDLIDKNLDITSKSLALFMLISLGVNENHVFFMHSFNDLIEFLIDTGLIFNIIEATPVVNLKLLTIEMLLNYCYQHWNAKKTEENLSIQSRITIFRLLCNIKLEVTLLENLQPDMLHKMEFKIQSTIREIIKKNYCHDYFEFIPMISQAISISQTHSVKYLFYDILYLMVSQHYNCCMRDYISDQNTGLKYLVQHGFWSEHNERLIGKVDEIYEFLKSNGFENVQNWYQETNYGKKYILVGNPFKTIPPGDLTTKIPYPTVFNNNSETPGGFLLFK